MYSIIVPTYRRREPLARFLRAVEALDFPRDQFEVLVVDDGSPSPPADLVASLGQSVEARLVAVEHGGPASARNAGARLAQGRYLVFTDDDCEPQADWLRAIDRWTSSAEGPVAIGGHTVNVLADNVYAAASQGIVDYLYEYFGDNPTPRRFFTSNNLVIPRDDFIEIGGFDETFSLAGGEDRDLCERWLDAGKPMQYAADVVVRHSHALGFAKFNRQHYNYGRGAFDLHRSRAHRGERSLKVEPIRFYVGLVAYPLRRSRSRRSLLLALLHAWSQTAYAAGYFSERIRRGWLIGDRRVTVPRLDGDPRSGASSGTRTSAR